MEASVVAAIISSSVTATGFFVSNWFIGRRIDKGRAEDSKRLAQFQSELTRNNLLELEAIKLSNQREIEAERTRLALQGQEKKESRDNRREALELLLNASSIAKSAAKALRHDLTAQSGAERVQHVAESLQKMSPFFEEASAAERNLHLIRRDVSEVQEVQQSLVTMLLLLDLNAGGQDLQKLDLALETFSRCVHAFQDYVRSATADSC